MPLPSRVDAALLYPAAPEPDFAAIAQSVQEIMAPSGLALEIKDMKPGQGVRLEAPGYAITLGLAPKRLAAGRLAGAVASDYTRLQGVDCEALTGAHGAFIAVIAEARGFEAGSQDSFETLLALTQIAACQIALELPPLCLHWGQSRQILPPERFLAMADVMFPLPLFCHPRPFSSGRMAEGTQCIGFHLDHAEEVLGRPLTFREAPARLPYLLDRAYAFIDHCRETGRVLGDGASFGAAPGEVIAVAHTPPDADDPKGRIELTLREREGVFQLQPEGAANPEGLAEARADGAPFDGPAPVPGPSGNPMDDFFSRPDSAARERVGQAGTGAPALGGLGGGTTAALDGPGGIERLREASRERLDREKRRSDTHVKQTQWIGFLLGAGIPGWQSAATSPGMQKFLPWLAMLALVFIHPIAALLLLLVHLVRPMPYYVYGGAAFLVVFGATLTGAPPELGYMDLTSILLGTDPWLPGMGGAGYEPTNFIERDYYNEVYDDAAGGGGTGWGALFGFP